MKKTIRLTESDLMKIVKRVVKEQGYKEDEMWDSFSDDDNLVELHKEIDDIKYKVDYFLSERDSIISDIDNLMDKIEDSDISEEVREYLIELLRKLEDSITSYY